MNTNFTVGQIVMFGRPNGEKTRGKIVDINMKTVTVVTTEDRGKTKAGVKWRVAPSFITSIDGAQVPAQAAKPAKARVPSFRNEENKSIAQILRLLNDDADVEGLIRMAYNAGWRDYRNALVGE